MHAPLRRAVIRTRSSGDHQMGHRSVKTTDSRTTERTAINSKEPAGDSRRTRFNRIVAHSAAGPFPPRISFDAQAAFRRAVPPALTTLFGLHETGDSVLSAREARHVRQAAVRPYHPPHAGMSRIRHQLGSAHQTASTRLLRTRSPALSSIRSRTRTGTRSKRPMRIVGMSPRRAASYEVSRLRPK